MSGPSLGDLERRRAGLFARLAAIGDFRRGSVSENYRRCGKPNCACARPGHRGHGPRWLWTRTVAGRGTRGRQLAEAEVPKVRAEVERYQEFAALTEQIAEVSEAICEARPVTPQSAGPDRAAEGLAQLRGRIQAEFAAELDKLTAAAVQALAPGGAGLEKTELAIRAGLSRVGGSLLEGLLAADPGHRGPRAACGAGHEAEFISYRDKTFDTVLGAVTILRAWYHCTQCEHGLAPRDAELGMAESMSPGLTAMNDQAAAAMPFAKAAGLLEHLAGVRLTVKRTERAAEASGNAQATAVRTRAALITARKLIPMPPSPQPDMLYGALDGTGCPMTGKETAGRDGKGEDGKARTREIKLAVFFTQDTLDEKGRPVRDPASSSYLATFEPAAVFGDLVEAEGIRRGAAHIRQVTILGDGAAWIWNIASSKFPEATQIVDLFHAREHLHDLARSLEFMLGDQKDSWLAARMEDLEYGDIDGICKAARVYPLAGVKKDEMDTALGYFEHNAPRMRYKWFRQCGLFVGSGVVEAGCKSVIGQRLKQSGMHWSTGGADAITTLRCLEASSEWEAICRKPHNQTDAA
ncbi:MAG: ISKra4 family transposase [Streptosporangiaceae bacterium]